MEPLLDLDVEIITIKLQLAQLQHRCATILILQGGILGGIVGSALWAVIAPLVLRP